MIDPTALGARLRALRKQRRETQVDAAEAVGISRSYLGEIETGSNPPGLQALSDLAAYYGVPVGYLLGEIGEWSRLGQRDKPVQSAEDVRIRQLWGLLGQPEKAMILRVIDATLGMRGQPEIVQSNKNSQGGLQ